MFWCKSKTKTALAFISGIPLLVYLSACNSGGKESGTQKYFDIKGFFAKDSILLSRQNKPVFKTVTHNGVTESKEVHIANWGQELSLFKEADINRPAWKNSYTVITSDDMLVYRTKDPELKMREMIIKLDKHKVKWIVIFNKTKKNFLYQTTEKLSYYPDSLYLIEKIQTVKLIGTNNYKIQGVIGK